MLRASSPRPAERNHKHVASTEAPHQVYTRGYVIPRSLELAIVIRVGDFNRIIDRLDGCQSGSWPDLWLAAAGAAAALGVSALIGALTLPSAMPGTVGILWALMAAGVTIFCLCVTSYITQQCHRGKEIDELKKDLEIYLPGDASTSDIA